MQAPQTQQAPFNWHLLSTIQLDSAQTSLELVPLLEQACGNIVQADLLTVPQSSTSLQQQHERPSIRHAPLSDSTKQALQACQPFAEPSASQDAAETACTADKHSLPHLVRVAQACLQMVCLDSDHHRAAAADLQRRLAPGKVTLQLARQTVIQASSM